MDKNDKTRNYIKNYNIGKYRESINKMSIEHFVKTITNLQKSKGK